MNFQRPLWKNLWQLPAYFVTYNKSYFFLKSRKIVFLRGKATQTHKAKPKPKDPYTVWFFNHINYDLYDYDTTQKCTL